MTTATLLPPQEPPARLPGAERSWVSMPVGRPVLDVVVPVHDEEVDLERSVRRLHAHLRSDFPYPFRITVADNASTDSTFGIARALAELLPEVAAVHLEEKGRGRALRAVWSASDAPVLAYMDVDLSTDLAALAPLVAPLLSGHSDLAIGTRLARGSQVVRGSRREVISRCYNLLLRGSSTSVSPTPSAGSRRSAATSPGSCCRWSRTPAGSSTPNCSSWPNAAGSGSPR